MRRPRAHWRRRSRLGSWRYWKHAWRYHVRETSWRLTAICLAVLGVGLVVWALLARGHAQFDWVVGWANILALAIATGSTAVALYDRTIKPDRSAKARLSLTHYNLPHRLLSDEREQLAQLLGTDQPDTRYIDVAFTHSTLRYRSASGPPSGTFKDVLDFYREVSPRRMVIIGDPGSGKTVLALYLVVRLLERQIRRYDHDPVPVRFSLANFDPTTTLADWLTEDAALRFRLPHAVAQELVRRRLILPVLDGLDEVADDQPRSARLLATVDQINGYLQGADRSPLVVTCRQAAYDQLPVPIMDATVIEIQPLIAQQITAYLRANLLSLDDELAWLPLLEAIEDESNPSRQVLLALLGTPWRLNLAVTFGRDGGNPADLLAPHHRAAPTATVHGGDILLDRYIPARVRLHSTGQDHRFSDPDRVITWLTAVTRQLTWQAAHGGSGTDIVLERWWPAAGLRTPRYLHAAVNLVTWLGQLALLFWLAHRLAPARVTAATVSWSSAAAATALAVLALLMTRRVVNNGLRWWPAPSRIDTRQAVTVRRFIRTLTTNVRSTLAIGLTVAVPFGVAAGALLGPFAGITIGNAAGFLAVFANRFLNAFSGSELFGLIDDEEEIIVLQRDGLAPIGPRSDLRNDLTVATAVGAGFGLAAGLLVTLLLGPWPGFAAMLATAIGFGPVFSAQASLRYGIATVIAAIRGRQPLRFADFLDWANTAGILRQTGIAYQFRHQELQSWIRTNDRLAPP